MEKKSKLMLISAVLMFGTIGIFRRYTDISSSILAMVRGFIGSLFLVGVMLAKKQKFSLGKSKKDFILLCISGMAIGINWILIFEAYLYTSVAVATLCYYMAPIFVLAASPLVGERLTLKKTLCIVAALIGMVFVSGVLQTGLDGITGALLALGAAALYASDIMINKKVTHVPAYDRTVVQLFVAALVVVPYVILTEDVGHALATADTLSVILMIVMGVLHTGVAYALYFGSMEKLKVQTVALYSYIDPITAIILSAIIFKENIGWTGIVGMVLILGSTIISELSDKAVKE
ncbi:MAG: EamA family transporter [Clostridia bacterium]|nr:EamA family transporter [Clostridia bacterium]